MDDFNVTSLHESKNEWGARLLTILTPLVIEGFYSIYEEACSLCKNNDEMDKHLMTFQNFISRIPKWNATIVESEQQRICDKSGCSYLEDLVTCVHIIQLKLLTAVRVGTKQKKIDVKIPKLTDFIHRVYIFSARKIYKNVYLFERGIPPLQIQKNSRELEILIQESILNAVRERIPIDVLLRSYLDETTEEDVRVEIQEEVIEPPVGEEVVETATRMPVAPASDLSGTIGSASLSFDNLDRAINTDNKEEIIVAPKDVKTLEEVSTTRHEARKLEEDDDDDDDNTGRITINDEPIKLTHADVHNLEPPSMEVIPDLLLDDIEVI